MLRVAARRARPHTAERKAREAQAARVTAKLQIVLQTRMRAMAKQWEQRRWRQEQGDNRYLFATLEADKAIKLPIETLKAAPSSNTADAQPPRVAGLVCSKFIPKLHWVNR